MVALHELQLGQPQVDQQGPIRALERSCVSEARDQSALSRNNLLKCTSCALQYIMLHLAGYKVSMDDLKAFRQIDSITPGHPEVGVTEGIEVTTGPLGQGEYTKPFQAGLGG